MPCNGEAREEQTRFGRHDDVGVTARVLEEGDNMESVRCPRSEAHRWLTCVAPPTCADVLGSFVADKRKGGGERRLP